FPLFSSLGGMSDQVSGRAIKNGVTPADSSLGRNNVVFNYPESGDWEGKLTVGDHELWQVADGISTISSTVSTTVPSLKLAFNGVRTNYTLLFRSNKQCGGSYESLTVMAD